MAKDPEELHNVAGLPQNKKLIDDFTMQVDLGRSPNANYSLVLPPLFTQLPDSAKNEKPGAIRKKGGGK